MTKKVDPTLKIVMNCKYIDLQPYYKEVFSNITAP
jgi:hypothetical protein